MFLLLNLIDWIGLDSSSNSEAGCFADLQFDFAAGKDFVYPSVSSCLKRKFLDFFSSD